MCRLGGKTGSGRAERLVRACVEELYLTVVVTDGEGAAVRAERNGLAP